MHSAPVVQLLKVGHFLFEKQYLFKKFTGVKKDFFKEEINSLLQMILIHMGIIEAKGKSFYVVNKDHYQYVTNMFWTFCRNKISIEEMFDLINVLKIDALQIIEANGDKITYSLDPTNVLGELKGLLNQKRKKLNKFFDGVSDLIRAEMNSIQEAFEEIAKL